MTYLEYAKIVCPEFVWGDGFVRGCPATHGLPSCACNTNKNCIECYAENEIPDEEALELIMRRVSKVPEWVQRTYKECTTRFEAASDDEINEMLEVLYG